MMGQLPNKLAKLVQTRPQTPQMVKDLVVVNVEISLVAA